MEVGSAAVDVPLALPPASGGVLAWALVIWSKNVLQCPEIVAAWATVRLPDSEPLANLYAAPIAIVVDDDESKNSVKPESHEENAAFDAAVVW